MDEIKLIIPQKQNYIDAVRGWAIILVITCHAGGMFPGMPYPIKRLTNFGWHGVQLFFLASAVTLLMSWNAARKRQSASVGSFFIRRLLRIAPMYYIGALIYFIAEPPTFGFDGPQLLRSFLFVNAWSPDWMPATGGWTVVPGGWSIGVEFTFYALFPLLAAGVTTLKRACYLFVFAVVTACICNDIASVHLAAYPPASISNFLSFWFPNQFPVFALGMIVYFCIGEVRTRDLPGRVTYSAAAAICAILVLVAEHPYGSSLFLGSNLTPPILWAALGFAAFIYVLARSSDTLLTHPLIRQAGVLSFSAYVLHFLFVRGLPHWTGGLIDTKAENYAAIPNLAVLWVVTMPCTFAAAWVAHHYIEQPGIKLAHRLTSGRRPVLTVHAGDEASWVRRH